MLGDRLLLTGGADGGVHAWRISNWLDSDGREHGAAADGWAQHGHAACVERAVCRVPDDGPGGDAGATWRAADAPQAEPSGTSKTRDSRSEHVRCLSCLGQDDVLVGTNRGLLYRLAGGAGHGAPPAWRRLWQSPRTSPVLEISPSTSGSHALLTELSGVVVALDLAACQDGGVGGRPGTPAGLSGTRPSPAPPAVEWQPFASPAAPARGAFWVPAPPFPPHAPNGMGVAAGPATRWACCAGAGGELSVWDLGARRDNPTPGPVQLAGWASPYGRRVTALSAAWQRSGTGEQVCLIVAGDDKGNLCVFTWALTCSDALDAAAVEAGGRGDSRGPDSLDQDSGPSLVAGVRLSHGGGGPIRLVRAFQDGTLASAGSDGCTRFWTLEGRGGTGAGRGRLHCLAATQHEDICTTLYDARLDARTGLERGRQPGAVGEDGSSPAVGGSRHDAAVARPAAPRVVAGFLAEQLIIRDGAAGVEVARVACGGWRRPTAFFADGPDALAFLHASGRGISRYSRSSGRSVSDGASLRQGPHASAARWHSTLLPGWHGMEVNAVALRLLGPRRRADGASGASDSSSCVAAVARPFQRLECITGGEDGTLRTLVLNLNQLPCSFLPGHTARAVSGNAIRSLCLLPGKRRAAEAQDSEREHGVEARASGREYGAEAQASGREDRATVIAGGSKHTTMVWALESGAARRPWAPELAVLASAEESAGSKPNRAVPGSPARSAADARILSIAALELASFPASAGAGAGRTANPAWTPPAALLLTGSGSGEVCVSALAPAHAPCRVARLDWKGGLALAAACCGAGQGDRPLGVIGTSDGSLAVWELAPLVQMAAAKGGSAQSSAAATAAAGGAAQALGSEAVKPAAAAAAPVLVVPGVHQSGVNALACVWMQGGGPAGRPWVPRRRG